MPDHWFHALLIVLLLSFGSTSAFAQGDEGEDEESSEDEAEVDETEEGEESDDADSAGPSVPGAAAASPEDAEISIYRELKTVESQVNDLKAARPGSSSSRRR